MPQFDMVITKKKTGDEVFHVDGDSLGFSLIDFWRWSMSDLISNTARGRLAEYLVACALGVADGVRVEWDAYDLKTDQGLNVEVKSAAYLQSWTQKKASAINFDIRPTYWWDVSTNKYATERKRYADVYVFAVLKHQDKATLNPRNVAQWEFYILPTLVLDSMVPLQRSISLRSLLRLNPTHAEFGEVAQAIGQLFPSTSKT